MTSDTIGYGYETDEPDLSWLYGVLIGLGIIAVLTVASGLYQSYKALPQDSKAAVRLTNPGEFASGVHIGNGYVLTAAHVPDKPSITVETEDKRKFTATVLWKNETYDVALLQMEKFDHVAAAAIDCTSPAVNDVIRTTGNPLGENYITSWGHVAGTVRAVGPWAAVMVADLSITSGNSGGPVYNDAGDVVGIIVGAQRSPNGPTGFSTFVPSSTICKLMARI